jgi:putative sigma-54 modulation protein
MEIQYLTKEFKLTQMYEEYATKRLTRLERYSLGEPIEATAHIRETRGLVTLEVTFLMRGRTLRAEEAADDLRTAVDLVSEKLERQLTKLKARLKRHKGGIRHLEEEADTEPEEVSGTQFEELAPLRVKQLALVPLDIQSAIEAMELVGHDFYVFRNAENSKVSVVYKRRDEGYGLIETE